MPTKKPAAVKKSKSVPPPAANAQTTTAQTLSAKRVWTLPIAMLMVVVASAGLWLAVRESSNAPQAATPAAASAGVAPVAPAASTARAPVASGAPAKPAETPTVAASKPVSITGCLQRDGDGFVLKDTDGTGAPKSRSWKSGFLKKRSASVDLLDTTNAAQLGTHVGKRVSVTGPLVDRELRVQSLRRVAATCE